MAVTWKKVITANAEEALAASTALSISGQTLTLTKGDASTDTVTLPDDNTEYSAGTNMSLDGTTFSSTDTVYTLPEATSSAKGGIELFSDTDNSVAATAVSATASRTYGLQLNSDGQGVVNVPWTDTVNMGTGFTVTGSSLGTQTTITQGDSLTLAAGTGISTTPTSDGVITIANTVTDSNLTDEEVEDIVGAMLTGNTETNITVTYQDADGTIDFASTDTTYSEATGSAEGLMSTAHHDKLDAIEASADVTDATNVEAAGALMDSELAGIAAVKATTGTFLSADESKLDAIEASADVTDKANVATALASLNGDDTLTIGDAGNDCTININGDMTVSGTTTTVNTETINLADNVITLNSNYSGASPSENGGIEVERGTQTNAELRWNETDDRWQIAMALDNSYVGSVDVNASATAPTSEGGQGVGSFYMADGVPYIRVE